MFGVLGWIVFGLIVGVIAKLVMPGRDPGGFVVTVLLGIAGAVLGGLIGRLAGLYGPGDAAGFVMSTLGAVALLFAYQERVVYITSDRLCRQEVTLCSPFHGRLSSCRPGASSTLPARCHESASPRHLAIRHRKR